MTEYRVYKRTKYDGNHTWYIDYIIKYHTGGFIDRLYLMFTGNERRTNYFELVPTGFMDLDRELKTFDNPGDAGRYIKQRLLVNEFSEPTEEHVKGFSF